MLIHFGDELQIEPHPYQRRIVKHLISLGVQIIIGAHPHVLQPHCFHNNTLVAYSLGNFLFYPRRVPGASQLVICFVFAFFMPLQLLLLILKWLRAVFKWLSKVITWLRFLRLVIGLKDSRQFFNQWEAEPKPIAPCTRDISRASGELQVIARNCDWFMELFVPVVIGRSNCFGFGFSTVIWKPLYHYC